MTFFFAFKVSGNTEAVAVAFSCSLFLEDISNYFYREIISIVRLFMSHSEKIHDSKILFF